jgi:hypothetical protein
VKTRLLLAAVCLVLAIPAGAEAASRPLRIVDKHVSLVDTQGRFFVHVKCQSATACVLRYVTVKYRDHQLTFGVGRARAHIAAGHVARVRVSRLARFAIRMLERHHRLSVLMEPLSSLPPSPDQGATSRVTLFP